MPRSNIDLSFLGMLGEPPDTIPNEAVGAQIDHKTGKFFDPKGNDVTDIAKKYGTGPYQNPDFWKRVFYPGQSGAINELNYKYNSMPIMANRANDTALDVGGKNVTELGGNIPAFFSGLTPRQTAILSGNNLTASNLGQEARAAQGNTLGVPGLGAENDLVQAQVNLGNTKAMLNRQPVVNASLDQASINNLAQELRVEPLKINLLAQQLAGELKRLPNENELRDWITRNQLYTQRDLVAPQINFESSQRPVVEAIARAKNITDAYKATHASDLATTPYPADVDINKGTITPGNRNGPPNPYFKSFMDTYNAMTYGSGLLGGASGIGGQTPISRTTGLPVSIPSKPNVWSVNNMLNGSPQQQQNIRPPYSGAGGSWGSPSVVNPSSTNQPVSVPQQQQHLIPFALQPKQTTAFGGPPITDMEFWNNLSRMLGKLALKGSNANP